MHPMRLKVWTAVACALLIGGCATYTEGLNRGQRLYEENEYERALAIWRALGADIDSLDYDDQARYSYLRGMTDYRLGFRFDARHWLALAKAVEQEHPGGLSEQWKQRLEAALDDLNKDWYGGAESGFDDSASTSVERKKTVDEQGNPVDAEPAPEAPAPEAPAPGAPAPDTSAPAPPPEPPAPPAPPAPKP